MSFIHKMAKVPFHFLSRPLVRSSPPALISPSFSAIRNSGTNSNWQGRQTDEHINDRDDTQNVQVDASKSGKADRAAGTAAASQATAQSDHGDQNKKAKEDHPEAPGPVLGMNDERGGVSRPDLCFQKHFE